jgi:hypothetical protein
MPTLFLKYHSYLLESVYPKGKHDYTALESQNTWFDFSAGNAAARRRCLCKCARAMGRYMGRLSASAPRPSPAPARHARSGAGTRFR